MEDLRETVRNVEALLSKTSSKGRGKAKGKEYEVPAAKKAVTGKDKIAEKEARKKTSQNSVKGHAPASHKACLKGKSVAMENDANTAPKSAGLKGKAKGKKDDQPSATESVDAASAATTKAIDGKVATKADGKTWICICRPTADLAKELDVDEEGVPDTCDGGKDCMCMKPADHHPNHKWIVTKKGFELLQEWNVQQAKRDQESFDMYIFNDFSGYGTCEVIENMFLAFAKEEKKGSQDPLTMWSIIESIALFLTAGDLMTWHMIDDSEGNAKRIMLIGTMLLTTIDILIGTGLFVNNGLRIRNIGLILSQYLQFAVDEDETCQFNENGWKALVVAKADKHNVALQGLADIDMIVDGIRSEDEDRESDGDDEADRLTRVTNNLMNMTICYKSRELWGVLTVEKLNSGNRRTWKRWNWAIELAAYMDVQAVKVGPTGPSYGGKIGGNFYDLTTKRNQGPHMKRYKLGEGMSGSESD